MPLSDKTEDRLRRIALWSARFGFGPAARPRRSGRPLPLAAWMLGLGLIAIGFVAYNYWDQQYELILALRDANPVDEVAIAEARNDILRNTLTAIAGFAAAAVLLLNFQKQRHEEYNATQQRIAELRIQAVGQLGDESPSVRIGGLHNLERLGESHPELRQIVLDEICSYLRLGHRPQASEAGASDETEPEATQGKSADDDEREVRLIAQEILQRHLKFATREHRGRYWSHERLNLKNADLVDPDLAGGLLCDATFKGARMRGYVDFELAEFRGNAEFSAAELHGFATFAGTRFKGNAYFARAEFDGTTTFVAAGFEGGASFDRARFGAYAGFASAQFGWGANFRDAQFIGYASFQDAIFKYETDFKGASINTEGAFDGALFGSDVDRAGKGGPGDAITTDEDGAQAEPA